jgi:hypothetical protein
MLQFYNFDVCAFRNSQQGRIYLCYFGFQITCDSGAQSEMGVILQGQLEPWVFP